jgi:Pregnancy-associated plasma protein-A/Secretion system C-terminal sorting domain
MHSKKIVVLAFTLLQISIVWSQHFNCGSMDLLQAKIKANPALQQVYDDARAQLELTAKSTASRSDRAAIVYIPVVFHIIHNGQPIGTAENISDAQVLSQIDELNADFAGNNSNFSSIPSAFKTIAAVTNIRFCLAKYNPTGQHTTGIERINLGQAGWDQSDMQSTIKPTTIWDHTKYLNIWSIKPKIGGYLDTSGILAYAVFPFSANASDDGVVSRYNVIGTKGILYPNYKLGRTLTHEIGHCLGLFHTWGDDNGTCNGSDNVNDTPNEADKVFGCPTFPYFDACATKSPGVMFMNYMDYTDDNCKSMFTRGQNTAMQTVINGSRSGYKTAITNCYDNIDLESLNIIYPTDSVCSGVVSPIVSIKNVGVSAVSTATVAYSIDGSTSGNLNNWSGSLATTDVTIVHLPSSTTLADGIHVMTIYISSVNGAGPDGDNTNDTLVKTFVVKSNGVGVSVPYIEDFEIGYMPPANGDLFNPNNDLAWDIATVGAYGMSTSSAIMDNSNYSFNPSRRVDGFSTASIDLTHTSRDSLSFDVAYSPRNSNIDSLTLYYSLNCGSTWSQLWKDGGLSLATSTAGNTSSPFVPTATDWKNISMDVSQFAGLPRVSFKFENNGHWGNALYIDNINLRADKVSSIATIAPSYPVSIYPNPTSGITAVRLPEDHPYTDIAIINALGQTVLIHHIIDSLSLIDVRGLCDGLYTIHLSSGIGSQSARMLVSSR